MEEQAIFTCVMEKLPRPEEAQWDHYQVARIFMDDERDILSEGCYYACRSSIDTYYRFLSRQEQRYSVYWINEYSFEVYDHILSHCA